MFVFTIDQSVRSRGIQQIHKKVLAKARTSFRQEERENKSLAAEETHAVVKRVQLPKIVKREKCGRIRQG